MRFYVLSELRQPIGSSSTVDFDEPSVTLDGLDLRDLRGSLALVRTNRGLFARVTAGAVEPTRCVRCLADVVSQIQIQFQEEFIPTVDPNTGAPVRIAADADAFRIEPDFTLDLREALRQYILMSEPAKPLCGPDCAGLCPRCGVNWNEQSCDCAPETDDRWRALAGQAGRETEGS